MNIYVASSWRNPHQAEAVIQLRAQGFEVCDFRNPAPGDIGFHWGERFRRDLEALDAADAVVLVTPCGRSAHLELGYAIGRGKRSCILTDTCEPELMYKLADRLFYSLDEMIGWLKEGK